MNELTTPNAGSLVVPGRGFEGMKLEKGDLIIPRCKLLQSTSPEVQESKFEGAKPGLLINSLTLDVLPPRFVPIFTWKEWFRFNPRNRDHEHFDATYDQGALIWRSLNPDDPKVQEQAVFGENGEAPVAMTVLNFFSLFSGVSMPIVVGFAKTSYKAGKQLLSLARFCGGDMWSRAYQLGVELQKNDQGTYHPLTVPPLGERATAERHIAETWWKMFSDKAAELKVHEREPGEDAVEA